jgi:hypothetical protein
MKNIVLLCLIISLFSSSGCLTERNFHKDNNPMSKEQLKYFFKSKDSIK